MPDTNLKLPWKLIADVDPGCRVCSKKGVRGERIVNADGETVLESGHDTFFFEEFDLELIVAAVNDYAQRQLPQLTEKSSEK